MLRNESLKEDYKLMFPDNRFDAEGTLRQAQMIMLRMLRIVDHICRKHGIVYWLDGGTLLGAVRHKGFIPWDDDVDIAMPRADLNRFKEIVQQELPEGLFFQTPETDSNYRPLFLPKIRDKRSRMIEDKENVAYCQGIFIDIFPFDSYPNQLILSLLSMKHRMRSYRRNFSRGSLARLLYVLALNTVGLPVICALKLFSRAVKCWRDLICNNQNDEIMTYGVEYDDKTPYEKKEIFPLQEICFEGYSFFAPGDYDVYLRKAFGDYMTMPPVDQRMTHAKKIIIDITQE